MNEHNQVRRKGITSSVSDLNAYLLTNTKQPVDRVPTLNEVLRLVARLGGFIGRKSDGEPGVKTIWLGLQEARVAAATLAALREQ